jgi:hypothetical protein
MKETKISQIVARGTLSVLAAVILFGLAFSSCENTRENDVASSDSDSLDESWHRPLSQDVTTLKRLDFRGFANEVAKMADRAEEAANAAAVYERLGNAESAKTEADKACNVARKARAATDKEGNEGKYWEVEWWAVREAIRAEEAAADAKAWEAAAWASLAERVVLGEEMERRAFLAAKEAENMGARIPDSYDIRKKVAEAIARARAAAWRARESRAKSGSEGK